MVKTFAFFLVWQKFRQYYSHFVTLAFLLSLRYFHFVAFTFLIQASKKWRQNMLDLSRQKVGAQLSAMNAATAQLVTMSIDDEIDTSRVGAAVAQM